MRSSSQISINEERKATAMVPIANNIRSLRGFYYFSAFTDERLFLSVMVTFVADCEVARVKKSSASISKLRTISLYLPQFINSFASFILLAVIVGISFISFKN